MRALFLFLLLAIAFTSCATGGYRSTYIISQDEVVEDALPL